MNRGDLVCVILLAAVLWPWAIGLVDLVSWCLSGTTLTSIPWGTSVRGMVLLFWPVFWVAAFLVFALS